MSHSARVVSRMARSVDGRPPATRATRRSNRLRAQKRAPEITTRLAAETSSSRNRSTIGRSRALRLDGSTPRYRRRTARFAGWRRAAWEEDRGRVFGVRPALARGFLGAATRRREGGLEVGAALGVA